MGGEVLGIPWLGAAGRAFHRGSRPRERGGQQGIRKLELAGCPGRNVRMRGRSACGTLGGGANNADFCTEICLILSSKNSVSQEVYVYVVGTHNGTSVSPAQYSDLTMLCVLLCSQSWLIFF